MTARTAGAAYTSDTLQVVFSSTKGAAAACANLLARARTARRRRAGGGVLARVRRRRARSDVPVEWLLTHQVGVPPIDVQLTAEEIYAWEPLIEALAAQAPLWEPGTAHGYHAITYGHLVSEVVRRIDGRTVGEFFADEFAAPLGLDWWIGLPEEQEPRVAPMIPMNPGGPTPRRHARPRRARRARAHAQRRVRRPRRPSRTTRDYRAAEIPAANGVANAARWRAATPRSIGGVDGGPSAALLSRPTDRRGPHAAARRAPTACCRSRAWRSESTFGLGLHDAGVVLADGRRPHLRALRRGRFARLRRPRDRHRDRVRDEQDERRHSTTTPAPTASSPPATKPPAPTSPTSDAPRPPTGVVGGYRRLNAVVVSGVGYRAGSWACASR